MCVAQPGRYRTMETLWRRSTNAWIPHWFERCNKSYKNQISLQSNNGLNIWWDGKNWDILINLENFCSNWVVAQLSGFINSFRNESILELMTAFLSLSRLVHFFFKTLISFWNIAIVFYITSYQFFTFFPVLEHALLVRSAHTGFQNSMWHFSPPKIAEKIVKKKQDF